MTSKSIAIAAYVDREMHKKFLYVAWRQRKSASELLREIVKAYLDDVEGKSWKI